jgi:uncharacterized membrane protein HdeD (DUF308 family)
MIAEIGLMIITAAWIFQAFSMKRNKKSLNRGFVLIYILGVFVLIYDSFSSGMLSLVVMNALSLIAAGIVFCLGLLKKKNH